MNILFVGAHHDDLELSSGGSVKRWVEEGHAVYSAILTNSIWVGPDGTRFRETDQVKAYCHEASSVLGYTPINLDYCDAFELAYSDDKVVDLLNICAQYQIDTLIAIWPYDAHKDHRIASEIALAASRQIPRVLLTRLSWNSTPQAYRPNYFVDITGYYEIKQQALKCYQDEYSRNAARWEKFMLSQAHACGLEIGCDYAEGFQMLKYLY